jgi:hypothetical protein
LKREGPVTAGGRRQLEFSPTAVLELIRFESKDRFRSFHPVPILVAPAFEDLGVHFVSDFPACPRGDADGEMASMCGVSE